MDKTDIVLAALSSADGATFTPVQVQKLLFLIDKRLAEETDGPHFNFKPYDYGPFDAEVYRVLEVLSSDDLAEIMENPELRWKKYRLTPEGIERGKELLGGLPKEVSAYISRLSAFVTSMSFAELVGTIYNAYPEMKVNSVFGE